MSSPTGFRDAPVTHPWRSRDTRKGLLCDFVLSEHFVLIWTFFYWFLFFWWFQNVSACFLVFLFYQNRSAHFVDVHVNASLCRGLVALVIALSPLEACAWIICEYMYSIRFSNDIRTYMHIRIYICSYMCTYRAAWQTQHQRILFGPTHYIHIWLHNTYSCFLKTRP